MPIQRPPTPQEADWYRSQGIDPDDVLITTGEQNTPANQSQAGLKPTVGQTIGKTALQHAGGYVGGGLGMASGIGLVSLAAPWLGGPELGLPADAIEIGSLISGGVSAAGGSYGGQKIQEAAEGKDVAQRMNQQVEEAREAHPLVSMGTDITGSALASGGWPNISNIGKSIGQLTGRNALSLADRAAMSQLGEETVSPAGMVQLSKQDAAREAMGKIVGSSIVNPAINTGIGLATGQGLPSGKELAGQVIGGALFSEQSPYGHLLTGSHANEPLPEPKQEDITENHTTPQANSPYTRSNADGEQMIDDKGIHTSFSKMFPKPDVSKLPDDQAGQVMTGWRKQMKMPVEEKRAMLEQAWIDKQKTVEPPVETVEQPKTEPVDQQTAYTNVKDVLNQPNSNITDATKPQTDDEAQTAILQQQKDDEQRRVQIGVENAIKAQRDKEAEILADQQKQNQIAKLDSQNKGRDVQQVQGQVAVPAPVRSLEDVIREQAQKELQERALNESLPKEPDISQAMKPVIDTIKAGQSGDLAKVNQAAELQQHIKEAKERPIAPTANTAIPDDVTRLALIQKAMDNMTDVNSDDYHKLWKEAQRLKTGLQSGGDENSGPFSGNLDSWLASKKIDTNGKVYDAMQGIPVAVWNGAIDTIRLGVKAGKAIHEAIKDGIDHIKANYKGNFDEVKLAAHLKGELKNAPNERQRPTTDELQHKGTDEHGSPTETSNRNSLLTSKKEQEEKGKVILDTTLGKAGKIVQPTLDRINSIPRPEGPLVAASIKKTLSTAEQRVGITNNKLLEVAKNVGLTKKDETFLDKVKEWENLNKKSYPLNMFPNRATKVVYNTERQIHNEIGQYRVKIGEPIYRGKIATTLKQLDWQHPTTMSQKVAQIRKIGTDKTAITQQNKDFIDNAVKYGKTPEQAKALLSDIDSKLQGSIKVPNADLTFFSGNRMAHGVPLPESWQTKGWLKNLETYYRRSALSSAFYEHVQSDPKVLSALGEKKDAWGKKIPENPAGGIANNPDVRIALKSLQGEIQNPISRDEGAAGSLAATLFVSNPGIEMHKAATNLGGVVLSFAEHPDLMVKSLMGMVTKAPEGIEHAKVGGVIRMTARSVGDFFDIQATGAERMQAISQAIRNISSLGGRTDKWVMGGMQAGLESAMPGKIGYANKGNITDQQFLKRVDPTYYIGKQYSPTEIQKLASQTIAYIHGTHDVRTMPPAMMHDGEVSGFLKLAHWSVAQTGRFMNEIYKPALRGDFKPFIMNAFGAAVGGYLIKELKEEIQGKTGNIPSLKEIAASEGGLEGNKSLVAYNMIAALQYAGFGGIMSQIAKYPFDRYYKNAPQGEVFPLSEIASDMTTQLGNLIDASHNDPNFDWSNAAIEFARHMLMTDIQLSRVAINNGINQGMITGRPAEIKHLTDNLRQLRNFDIVSHLPYDDQEASVSNPYMNIEQKQFKSTQDIGKAMSMLPGLVNNIIDTYKNNPDIMMSKLKALKENQYETFPSLETHAPTFGKYMDYLTRLKGQTGANQDFEDYMQHKIVNEMKASAVP